MTSKTTGIYGTGVSADLVRIKDWSRTALGPMEEWPSELVSTVNMALTSQLMACLIWGPERIQIHNDGFAQLMAAKKNTQGAPFRENWSEVLEEAESMLSLPMTTGKAWYAENIPFNILIDGKLQLRVCNTNPSPIWVQTDEGAREEISCFSERPCRPETCRLLALGKVLSLEVGAECIETQPQANLLLDAGCQQG